METLLLRIGDNIVDLLGVLEARESHFGAGHLGLRILEPGRAPSRNPLSFPGSEPTQTIGVREGRLAQSFEACRVRRANPRIAASRAFFSLRIRGSRGSAVLNKFLRRGAIKCHSPPRMVTLRGSSPRCRRGAITGRIENPVHCSTSPPPPNSARAIIKR